MVQGLGTILPLPQTLEYKILALRLTVVFFGSFAVGFGLVVVIGGLLWANDLASKVLCYALLLIGVE